jgi:hypothetical protein
MSGNESKFLPAILTDAQWFDIVSMSAESLSDYERLDLDSIIFDFRDRARKQKLEKSDGRSPSDIQRELRALDRLASKLVKRISALRGSRHALSAISAAMYAGILEEEREHSRNIDHIILQQMSTQIKLLDDGLDFGADLEKTVRVIEDVGKLLERSSQYVAEGASGNNPLVRQLIYVLDGWLRTSSGGGLVRTSDIQLAGKRGGKAGKHRAFVKKILELVGLPTNDGAIDGAIRDAQEYRRMAKFP